MAFYVSEPTLRKKPRKPCKCFWCGESIDGEFVSWMSSNDGKAETIRVHVECKSAWDAAMNGPDRDYYMYDGCSFGDHSRGCECPHGMCQCKKEGAA